MNNKIIDGKKIAYNIEEKLKQIIIEKKLKPCLAVVKIGDNKPSEIYVKKKKDSCRRIGIKFIEYNLDKSITENELINLIQKLNLNKEINGILIQLPLPKHINIKNIVKIIDPIKDIDCFTPYNLGRLFIGDFNLDNSLLPCTAKGCIKLIKSVENNLTGKQVCIVGRSNLIGKPLFPMLLNEDATVKILHSKSKKIKEELLWADIIIVAVGQKHFITSDFVKENTIIIDVGINVVDNKIYGDVDFDNVIEKVSYITPVPNGVGPMTVSCLMENVIIACLKQNKIC